MRVIVLGAGLLGVTSAYFLQQLGHEVTVIDRQGAPGAETSFANGGQISVSHAEPWANPSAPLKVLQWLGQEDAPLLFRIRADMRQWLWGLSFLRNCTPARTRHNIEQIVRLGTYSRSVLQQLRAAPLLAWGNVALLGLLSTSLAYVIYFRLIADEGPHNALTVTFIVPIFAVLWGWLLLNEPLSLAHLLGGGLIAVSLWMVLKPVVDKNPIKSA